VGDGVHVEGHLDRSCPVCLRLLVSRVTLVGTRRVGAFRGQQVLLKFVVKVVVIRRHARLAALIEDVVNRPELSETRRGITVLATRVRIRLERVPGCANLGCLSLHGSTLDLLLLLLLLLVALRLIVGDGVHVEGHLDRSCPVCLRLLVSRVTLVGTRRVGAFRGQQVLLKFVVKVVVIRRHARLAALIEDVVNRPELSETRRGITVLATRVRIRLERVPGCANLGCLGLHGSTLDLLLLLLLVALRLERGVQTKRINVHPLHCPGGAEQLAVVHSRRARKMFSFYSFFPTGKRI